MGFDFIVIMPLLLPCCGFFFVFEHGASFFGGFQWLPVGDGSTASCNFGALAGGDECTSFYSTILNQKPLILLKRSVVFPILLFSSISLHCSLKKAFLSLLLSFGTLHSDGYIFPSSLPFASLLFSAICKASSENHFAVLHFFFKTYCDRLVVDCCFQLV